jgi:hypothetical protein
MAVRVFISHSSKDKPAVEKLAIALREHGIEPWLDKWEINPGDDIVSRMNEGLEEATAGSIVFSQHSRDSRWVEAETSYLTYARVEEGKILLPIRVGDDAWVPPLLRPLAYRGIGEVDAIVDALLNRRPGPPLRGQMEGSVVERVVVSLQRTRGESIQAGVRIGQQAFLSSPSLPCQTKFGRDATPFSWGSTPASGETLLQRSVLPSSLRSQIWAGHLRRSAFRVTRFTL